MSPHRSPRASHPSVAAVVLAAGYSSRMQAFKPLLPFGETTVIGHVVGNLRAGGVDDIRIVTGHRAAELTPIVERLGATSVDNPDYDAGMYGSIRAGIASLPDDVFATLILPVDIPLIRAATIAAVVSTARETHAAVAHPTFNGRRGHPPVIARSLFADIVDGSGDGGLRHILAGHYQDAIEVPVIDRGILLDMDTPADYAHLTDLLATRHVPDLAECAAILDRAMTPDRVRRHARAVAALAMAIAERLAAVGRALDPALIASGALLHDVAKGHPHHAELGAALLAGLGFEAVARVVLNHMDLRLSGEPVIDESAVVFLADKLISEERRITLVERFAAGLSRFARDPEARAGALRRKAEAEAVLRAVEALIELPADAVQPLVASDRPYAIHAEPTP